MTGILMCVRGCRALRHIAVTMACAALFSCALMCAYSIPVHLMKSQLIESAEQLKAEGQYPKLMGGGTPGSLIITPMRSCSTWRGTVITLA